MKNKIIIANWKMNLTIKQTEILTKDIIKEIKKIKNLDNIEIVLCPSFVALSLVANLLKRMKKIALGAQNCFWEDYGAFTGEISPITLNEIGCKYVIVGHSERKKYLSETDNMTHQKVKSILNNNLIPIICLGETFEERQKGLKEFVIINQITKILEGIKLKAHQKIIIAYEPVWVIGSGQAIEPKEANYIRKVILQRLIDLYPLPIIRNNIRIIYGGSVDSKNIKNFVSPDSFDGVLVGGASLRSDEFIKMIKNLL